MKQLSGLIAVCLICLPAWAQEPQEFDASYHLVIARLLADEGEVREATESFIRAIELAPEDPYIRLEYSKFLMRQRRVEKAAQQLEAAVQLAPEDPEVLRLYADAQMKLVSRQPGALDRAKSALEKIRQIAPEDLESMVSLGQIYLGESKPLDAAEVFEEVLARTSGNRMVYRLLVDSLLRAGEFQRAETVLRQAIELDPQFTRARIGLAEILSQQGRHGEAVAALSAAPDSVIGDLDLQKRMALELHRTGELDLALESLDLVLQAEPSYFAGLYLKAVILTTKGSNQEAIELARRLVALHPENIEAAILLSRLVERQGDAVEAASVLEQTERRLRRSGDEDAASRAQMQRAVILARAENWEGVIAVFDRDLPELMADDRTDALLLYAEALSRSGRRGESLELLADLESSTDAGRAALAKQAEILFRSEEETSARGRIDELISTGSFDDLVRAAEVYQTLERYDDAIPILERALNLEPESIQVMFWLGASYERTGRSVEAEGMLGGLLELAPNFAPALNYLGYMWAEKGENLDQALELVSQAVALEPDNGAYIDSLGWAHYQLGQYEAAQDYLERAANLVGQDAVVFEHLGDLYVAIGQLDRAAGLYERALALQEDNAGQVQDKLDRLRGDM